MAAGGGDPPGRPDLVAGAGQLGQAVDPLPGMGRSVIGGPGGRVGEAEGRAEIDDRGLGREAGRYRGGLAVREGEEYQVGRGQQGRVGLLEGPPGQAGQVRVDRA